MKMLSLVCSNPKKLLHIKTKENMSLKIKMVKTTMILHL